MVSVIPKHIAAFALGTDHALYRKYKDERNPDTVWTGWARVGGQWLHDPVTIKRKDGEVDIFMMDHNHGLQQMNFNFLIGSPGPWKNLGGKLLSLPAVANRKGTVHTFHIGTDRALYHHSWNGANHSPFERLLGEVMHTHTPVAVSAGAQEVSVFAVGLADARLYHYHWDSTAGWETARQLPGYWAGTPTAVSDKDGCWDVFGVDPNGKINHIWQHAGEQSDLETISGLFESVECISWGPGRIDIFGSNLASGVSHKAWDGKTWSEWEDLGTVKVGRTTPVSHSPGSLCILVVGITRHMYIRVRNPKTGVWGAWTDVSNTRYLVSRVA